MIVFNISFKDANAFKGNEEKYNGFYNKKIKKKSYSNDDLAGIADYPVFNEKNFSSFSTKDRLSFSLISRID